MPRGCIRPSIDPLAAYGRGRLFIRFGRFLKSAGAGHGAYNVVYPKLDHILFGPGAGVSDTSWSLMQEDSRNRCRIDGLGIDAIRHRRLAGARKSPLL